MQETSAENEKNFLSELDTKITLQYRSWLDASTDRERHILQEMDAKVSLQHQTWLEASAVMEKQLLREFEAKVAGIYQAWLETATEREKRLFRDLQAQGEAQHQAWLKEREDQEQKAQGELVTKQLTRSQKLLAAWIRARVERDRIVVTLSAVAVGILLAAWALGGIHGIAQRLLTLGALSGFTGAVVFGWWNLIVNADHFEDALKGESDADLIVPKSDNLSSGLAAVGIVSILLLVLVTFVHTGRPAVSRDPASGRSRPSTAANISGQSGVASETQSLPSVKNPQEVSPADFSSKETDSAVGASPVNSKTSSTQATSQVLPDSSASPKTGGNRGNFSGGTSTAK